MSEPDADEPDAGDEDAQSEGGTSGDAAPGVDVEEIAAEPEGDAAAAIEDALERGEGSPDVDLEDVEAPPELVERVEDAGAETVATELAALRDRIEALESRLAEREDEVADLESRLARKQADFQNYKKRQEERLEEEKRRATEDLVARLLDVRDNLARALDQDEDADVRGGVESTLRQFDDELERENVTHVAPEPGDEVDPRRHEVLARVESDEPEGTVADLHRPGYEMAGKVLRPAQVTTSDGTAGEDGGPEDRAESEDEEAGDGEAGEREDGGGA